MDSHESNSDIEGKSIEQDEKASTTFEEEDSISGNYGERTRGIDGFTMPELQGQLKGFSIDENEEGKCQECEKWKKKYEMSEKDNKKMAEVIQNQKERIEELMKKVGERTEEMKIGTDRKPSCSNNTFRLPIQQQETQVLRDNSIEEEEQGHAIGVATDDEDSIAGKFDELPSEPGQPSQPEFQSPDQVVKPEKRSPIGEEDIEDGEKRAKNVMRAKEGSEDLGESIEYSNTKNPEENSTEEEKVPILEDEMALSKNIPQSRPVQETIRLLPSVFNSDIKPNFGFHDCFNCPSSCGISSIFFAFEAKRLFFCNNQFLIEINRRLQKLKIKFDPSKCTTVVKGLVRVGLLELVDDKKKICENTELDEALKEAMGKLIKGKEYIALLCVGYSIAEVGHCLALMRKTDKRDPKVMMQVYDVKKDDWWPKSNEDIQYVNRIQVFKIDKKTAEDLLPYCGRVKCLP